MRESLSSKKPARPVTPERKRGQGESEDEKAQDDGSEDRTHLNLFLKRETGSRQRVSFG